MTELSKLIEKTTNEIQQTFNESLENFLESIEGYKELSNEAKAIAKIFTCLTILIKLEKYENKKNTSTKQN